MNLHELTNLIAYLYQQDKKDFELINFYESKLEQLIKLINTEINNKLKTI